MASPLPKTNAPALVKNTKICHSVSLWLACPGVTVANSGKLTDPAVAARLSQAGGALANQETNPAPRKNRTASDSVAIVTAALVRKINQSSQSLPIVRCVSL